MSFSPKNLNLNATVTIYSRCWKRNWPWIQSEMFCIVLHCTKFWLVNYVKITKSNQETWGTSTKETSTKCLHWKNDRIVRSIFPEHFMDVDLKELKALPLRWGKEVNIKTILLRVSDEHLSTKCTTK